jgi:antitoxin (DNA-binding transcriptional repressor) of toxin-antitoxin stability system
MVPAAARSTEVPVRDLRNRTRDVMALVEGGWTVYLTSHGRRFAEIRPVTDAVVAPALSALLHDLDAAPPRRSGLATFVQSEREADRATDAQDPWQ